MRNETSKSPWALEINDPRFKKMTDEQTNGIWHPSDLFATILPFYFSKTKFCALSSFHLSARHLESADSATNFVM